jgi:hypothetical protein
MNQYKMILFKTTAALLALMGAINGVMASDTFDYDSAKPSQTAGQVLSKELEYINKLVEIFGCKNYSKAPEGWEEAAESLYNYYDSKQLEDSSDTKK